jgi:hypothetical protein
MSKDYKNEQPSLSSMDISISASVLSCVSFQISPLLLCPPSAGHIASSLILALLPSLTFLLIIYRCVYVLHGRILIFTSHFQCSCSVICRILCLKYISAIIFRNRIPAESSWSHFWFVPICLLLYIATEQVGSGRNPSLFHCGGVQFESRPVHRLS